MWKFMDACFSRIYLRYFYNQMLSLTTLVNVSFNVSVKYRYCKQPINELCAITLSVRLKIIDTRYKAELPILLYSVTEEEHIHRDLKLGKIPRNVLLDQENLTKISF